MAASEDLSNSTSKEDVSTTPSELGKPDPSEAQPARSSFQTAILIFALCVSAPC
jgi:hypothetical protein